MARRCAGRRVGAFPRSLGISRQRGRRAWRACRGAQAERWRHRYRFRLGAFRRHGALWASFAWGARYLTLRLCECPGGAPGYAGGKDAASRRAARARLGASATGCWSLASRRRFHTNPSRFSAHVPIGRAPRRWRVTPGWPLLPPRTSAAKRSASPIGTDQDRIEPLIWTTVGPTSTPEAGMRSAVRPPSYAIGTKTRRTALAAGVPVAAATTLAMLVPMPAAASNVLSALHGTRRATGPMN